MKQAKCRLIYVMTPHCILRYAGKYPGWQTQGHDRSPEKSRIICNEKISDGIIKGKPPGYRGGFPFISMTEKNRNESGRTNQRICQKKIL